MPLVLGDTVTDIDASPGTPGDSALGSKLNHRHRVLTGAPKKVVHGQGNNQGDGTVIALANHEHELDTAGIADAVPSIQLGGDVGGALGGSGVRSLQRIPLSVGTPTKKQALTHDGARLVFADQVLNALRPWLNVLTAGVVQGTLANNTARAANTAAFNAAIQQCLSDGRWLVVPSGRYEIYGALVANWGGFVWRGKRDSVIVQYDLTQPVCHVGQPRGSSVGTSRITMRGLALKYAGTATSASGGALELTGVRDSTFEEFDLGDVGVDASSATSVLYTGICEDDAGAAASAGNSFRDGAIAHWGYRGLHAPRAGSEVSGSLYDRIRFALGTAASKRDLSAVTGAMYAYVQQHTKSQFVGCVFDYGTVPTVGVFDTCKDAAMRNVRIRGVTLKRASSGAACFLESRASRVRTSTVVAIECTLDDSVTSASLFGMSQGGTFEASNVRSEQTNNAT